MSDYCVSIMRGILIAACIVALAAAGVYAWPAPRKAVAWRVIAVSKIAVNGHREIVVMMTRRV